MKNNKEKKDVKSGVVLCTFCGKKALYETKTNNNYLCDDNECKIQYIEEIIKPLK